MDVIFNSIVPLVNKILPVEDLKSVTLIWITFRGDEKIYGFQDFDYWTDAQAHMKKIQAHVNFKSTSYYLYMKGREKPVIQLHERGRQFSKWDGHVKTELKKLLT